MSALLEIQRKVKALPPTSAPTQDDNGIIQFGGKSYTMPELKVLEKAGALQTAFKNDPASTTVTGQPLQGVSAANAAQYGLFSAPGVRPERFSALNRPLSMARLLIEQGAFTKSEYFNELLEIMTGQTAESGTNATDFCGNPPEPGVLKVMGMNFRFGKLYAKTRLNSVPQIGFLRSRADVPGQILNAGPTANPLIPDIMYQLTDTRSILQGELFKLGVAIERQLELVLIQGNNTLSSTNAHWGWIQEFTGLDSLIKTGYTDTVTSQAAPAADSIVETFANIVSGTQASSGRNIVQMHSDIYYALKQRAARVGMDATEFVIVMRAEYFRALTDVYACSYAISRCTNGVVGSPQIIDQTTINNLRLEMLNGQYLLIEGVQVPVVFSDGMLFSQTAATQWTTSEYFVPVSWAGRPLIRIEYFPMDNPYAAEYGSWIGADKYRILNNGLYRVGYRSTGQCDEFHFTAQMRLILETPFLAARIDSIQFNYLAQTRSAYSGETAQFANGGVTYRYPYYGTL